MYRKILLTVDLSDAASWALAMPQAAEMAKASGGALHIITVVPKFGSSMVASYFPEGFEREALSKAKQDLQKLIADQMPAGVDSVAHIGHGDLHTEILRVVAEIGADLVVMASHAPDHVREFLVGSRADRVVRRSPVSVLVIRG